MAQYPGLIDVTGPSPVVLAAVRDTWCVVASGAGVAARLSAAGKRVLLSGLVPNPRGSVAGQSGMVSSFMIGIS